VVTTCVAFLRAINVSGRYVKMAVLAEHFRQLGLSPVRTYINSGNVVLKLPRRPAAGLAARIEDGLEPLLGFRSEVFLRTADEVRAVAASALTHERQVPALGEVNIAFLAAPLNGEQSAALHSLRSELDDFAHDGPHIYWLCRGRQSDSKFSNAALERRLRLRCTFRRVSMLQGLVTTLQEPLG
jgi:uncharacterized protein (DUF1697 family)